MIPPLLSFHTVPHKTIQLKELTSVKGAGILTLYRAVLLSGNVQL